MLETRLQRGRPKKMTVNGVPVRRGAQSSGVLFTVYFCPEDLYLIRDGAAARRKFMDTALCQLRPKYAEALARYNKAYESKTRILRDSEERPDLLAALPEFNHQMALAGAAVIHYRARFAARLAEYAEASHQECSGGRETLALVLGMYAPESQEQAGLILAELLDWTRAVLRRNRVVAKKFQLELPLKASIPDPEKQWMEYHMATVFPEYQYIIPSIPLGGTLKEHTYE